MRTGVAVNLQASSYHINLTIRVFNILLQSNLNVLHLLGHGGQNTLLQSVKLVETTPSTDLTNTQENTTHRLEIKSIITTEHQGKSSKLYSQRFN
jgi:hypothetical protein